MKCISYISHICSIISMAHDRTLWPRSFYVANLTSREIWLLTDMIVLWMYPMQCRLAATVRCLSHPSAHVRALSISVLRDILCTGSIRCSSKPPQKNGIHNPSYQYFNLDEVDWQTDIEKCLTWEAHSRISSGLPIEFLDTAAKELECTISVWKNEMKPCRNTLILWPFFY